MTRSQIIAEIKNKLKQFDESGLIDDTSINNWVKNAIKEFGGNIMQESETTILVENGKAKLPENFYALKYALKCDPLGYSTEIKDKKILFSAPFYHERISKTTIWDNQVDPPCFAGYECEYIKEESFFLDKQGAKHLVNYWYQTPMLLKLVRGYNKVKCDVGCPNMTIDSPYHISVQNNNYLNCNFQDGYIYLRYKGIPTDEFGEISIPETSRNKVQEYIIYTCTRRILEDIWVNDDNPNVVTKLNYFRQLEDQNYLAAKNDTINEGLLNWEEKVKRQLRNRTLKYELMFSRL